MSKPLGNAEYALTVGSLFSGIGGIDLGLERAGFRVIWQAETDPYASRVLAKHWPDVPNLGDVTTIDWSEVERPDVVCGGFPCQPVSLAGRQLAQRDERWLWPAFAHCLRSLRPDHVVVENVPGLLVRGMGDVLGDMADLGYDAEWTGVPAAAVGAPHLRWRVFIVAHAHGTRGWLQPVAEPKRQGEADSVDDGSTWALAHSDGQSRNGHIGGRSPLGSQERGWWSVEPDVGRVAHGIPSRVDRVRCLGNAVVPQVAELVGRRLIAHIDGYASGSDADL